MKYLIMYKHGRKWVDTEDKFYSNRLIINRQDNKQWKFDV